MQRIQARQCKIINPSNEELSKFLKIYHKQGDVSGQIYNYGLLYKEQLVAIMTFGYPRYNGHTEYELLRLCYHSDFIIDKGSDRMFKNFLKEHEVKSVVSYCDTTYFTGKVYENLGFSLVNDKGINQIIWRKGDKWITHSQLIKYGPDALIGTKDGKGADNESIMIREGWIKTERAPQQTYIYSASCDGKIYAIRDLTKDEIVYIGKTKQTIEHRFQGHCSDGSSSAISSAIRKYGKENFTVELIDTSDNYYDLSKKEQKYIKKYNTLIKQNGYNVFASGSVVHRKITTEETSRKITENNLRMWSDPEWAKKTSAAIKAGCQRPERNKKISENNYKIWNDPAEREKRIASFNKPSTKEKQSKNTTANNKKRFENEENRLHMSKKMKEVKNTPEAKAKQREQNIGRIWWNNGVKNKFCREQPEGFVIGMLKRRKSESI